MPYQDTPQNTPFEQQLHDDVEARRTVPTAGTVRIGDRVQAQPVQTQPPHPLVDTALQQVGPPGNGAAPSSGVVTAAARERTPLPIIIGLAMALGAVCVAGGAFMIRRIVPDSRPAFPISSQQRPGGDIVMDPSLVTQTPETDLIEKASPQETPAVEVEVTDLPSPSTLEPTTEVKTASQPQESLKPTPTEPTREEKNEGARPTPGEIFSGPSYEMTPPSGFSLGQKGRRTIWKHENGAQILVETGKAGKGTLREGWLNLERDLKKRYGDRYKSFGISDGQLAGQPAAVWEFELTGKDGITRRKIDIGIQYQGRGYAVLGSAPKEKFDQVLPDLRAALDSFRLKEPMRGEESNFSPNPPPSGRKISRQRVELPPVRSEPSTPRNGNTSEELPTPRPTAGRGY